MLIITGQDINKAGIGKDERNKFKQNFKKIRKIINEERSFKHLGEED